MQFHRLESTIMIVTSLKPLRRYYLQATLKDPWYFPKKDTICNGRVTIWGWLFFYIGCDTNMLKGGQINEI